ncbi:C1 family peptidase [Roseivirga echinicomitans]
MKASKTPKLVFTFLLLTFFVSAANAQTLKIDYRSYQTPVKNQGFRGTCTAFAVAAALEVLPGAPKDISENYIYAIRKMVEWELGDGNIGAGDFLANYPIALSKYGVLHEYELPYSPIYMEWSDFDSNIRKVILEGDVGPVSLMGLYVPKAKTFVTESQAKVFSEDEMRNVDLIRQLLLQGHKAIPVSYSVYAPQWKDNSGKPSDRIGLKGGGHLVKGVNGALTLEAAKVIYGDAFVPQILSGELLTRRSDPNEKAYGGHAVVIVGFDSEGFLLKNSWGTTWGDQGYFYISNDFHQLFVSEMAVFYGVIGR